MFASGQVFFSHPAFFEDVERCQATPEQEIQLPEYETYLIVIVDVSENALEKEWSPKLNSIDVFASAQGFRVLLFSGGAFSLVLQRKLLVELTRSLETPLLFKANSKTMILHFG